MMCVCDLACVVSDLAVYLLDERYKQKQAPLMLTLSYPMLVDKSDRQETSNERSNAYRGSDHYKPVIQAKRTLVGRGDEGGGVRIDVRSFTTGEFRFTANVTFQPSTQWSDFLQMTSRLPFLKLFHGFYPST